MKHPTPAATPAAADVGHDHGHAASEPWYKNGFSKAGIIFCLFLAVGYGSGTAAPEINKFIVYVLQAFLGVLSNGLNMIRNSASAIFLIAAIILLMKWKKG